MTPLALGIDLGTSGVRIALLDQDETLLFTQAVSYRLGLGQPLDWSDACTELIRSIPNALRDRVRAIAVDGTSGTLLACNATGTPLGKALAYSDAFREHQPMLEAMVSPESPAASCSGSLARALELLNRHPEAHWLRHQADWINGWLLEDWRWGEEGNNLRLGWELETMQWVPALQTEPWRRLLPQILPSGTLLGRISPNRAETLGLSDHVVVFAGTTDSNAAVLAAAPGPNDGVTVLGTTLVVKRFTPGAIEGAGITSHRVGGQWLCGGASNAGAGVLRRFFTDDELVELSRQIDPEQESGLKLLPLPGPGERFPVDDPTLQPVLEPRPISDALYLHGLLEGLATIEAKGWERLHQLGAARPQRVISLGGGARNPQWRRIRERKLGCPVVSSLKPPAAGVARLALDGLVRAQSNR
ncbi:MAG: FGGY-family carbohydrate kinase [Synechococcus sp.]